MSHHEHAGLAGPVAEWVKEVQLEIAPSERSASAAPLNDEWVLAYVLQREYRDRGVRLTEVFDRFDRMACRRLKRGGLGRPQRRPGLGLHPYELADSEWPLDEHDVQLVAEMIRDRSFSGSLRAPARLLLRLLETGRLFAQDHYGNGPLRLGPPKEGRLSWEPTRKGLLPVLTVAGHAWSIVSTDPLYYVDLQGSRCGPIEMSSPAHSVLEMLSAPPIAPAQAGRVRQLLRPSFVRLGLPLPPGESEEELDVLEPQPVLRLSVQEIESWSYVGSGARETRTRLVGEVTFAYGETEVSVMDEGLEVTGPQGRYVRDLAFEQQKMEELREQGLGSMPIPTRSGSDPTVWIDAPLSQPEVQSFVLSGVAALERSGWRVVRDATLPYDAVQTDDWYLQVDHDEHSDWFDLELGVEIDGSRQNLMPVLAAWLSRPDHARVLAGTADDQPVHLALGHRKFVTVPAGRLRRFVGLLVELYGERPLLNGRLRLAKVQAGPVLSGHDEDIAIEGGEALLSWSHKLRECQGLRRPVLSPELRCQLRPYQRRGVAWLQFLSQHELGGILADDMGLGKTLQVLAFIAEEGQRRGPQKKNPRPSLVVAPTSVVQTWQREAARFVPSLKVFVHHGSQRLVDADDIARYDVCVTSYALLLREVELWGRVSFHAIVLDEAQAIKNPRTLLHRAVQKLQGRVRLSLTGTPVENHLGELWSQFAFAVPGLLGSHRDFQQRFRTPIERYGDSARLEALRTRVRPFILRRLKTEVERQLPEKTEVIRTVELSGAQRDLYETIRVAMDKRVRQLLKAQGLARSAVAILDALLRLRQVCCHPKLLRDEAARGVNESAKLDDLMEMLSELHSEGRRTLVFSQFTSMLALIEPELTKRGLRYLKLTGETRNRQVLVDEFQKGDVPVFLVSLKAGGTGLTLTAADTVIHYDPWWNPAVQAQATDRTHRIGQTQRVFVYRLICERTVEEKILRLQEKKGLLAADLLEAKGGLRGFTSKDIEALFAAD